MRELIYLIGRKLLLMVLENKIKINKKRNCITIINFYQDKTIATLVFLTYSWDIFWLINYDKIPLLYWKTKNDQSFKGDESKSSLSKIFKPTSGFPLAAIALNLVSELNSAKAMVESSLINLLILITILRTNSFNRIFLFILPIYKA